MTIRWLQFVVIALAGLGLSACQTPSLPAPAPSVDFLQELPPGKLALRKISPGEYPSFALDPANRATVVRSIDHSLQYLAAPSSRQFFPYLDITHERAVASLNAMRELLNNPALSDPVLNQTIRQKFEVYQSIGAPSAGAYTGRVLFTGYFTPIYPASLTRTDVFRFPLYKRPVDLVRNEATGQVLGRKTASGMTSPYYTRRQIESGTVLAGQELVWVASRMDAYVISIQGSAILKLTDGKSLEIGFAGHNGFDYTSPGEAMVRAGVIGKQQHSLKGIKAYFASHPDDMDNYLWLNQRYVFFTERQGGPFGSLNVPVTAFSSIATDKAIYPRAMPAFLSTKVPVGDGSATRDFRSFLLDQDTGGAIRAAGRCDIYMGIGESAERLAGHQLYEGQLYYLAVKPELIQQYGGVPGLRMPAP